jgi:excisionase family DNA binding protein
VTEPDETREEARRNTRGRFDAWATSSTRHANTLSAVQFARLDVVARAAGQPSFGQSPFAIAAHLGVTKDTVYTWIAEKAMPAHKVGRLWTFQASEIYDWVRRGGVSSSTHDEDAE